MKELKDFYPYVLNACLGCAEVGDEDDPISTGVNYEDEEITVTLSFLASGRDSDDGKLTNVRITVEEISGTIINDYGDEEEFSEPELIHLATYIEKELPSLLEEQE